MKSLLAIFCLGRAVLHLCKSAIPKLSITYANLDKVIKCATVANAYLLPKLSTRAIQETRNKDHCNAQTLLIYAVKTSY